MYDTRRPHAQINLSLPFPSNSTEPNNLDRDRVSPTASSPLYSPWPGDSSASTASNKSRFSMSPTSPALMTSKLKLHGRKPSFTNKVSWLARASSSSSNSSSSAPYGKVSRPMRISEPRFFDNGGAPAVERGGPLGSGAQIVRTPQEALEGETASFEHRSDSGRGSALHEAIAELVEGSDEMLPSTDKRGVSRRVSSDPNDSESDYGEEREEDFPENITTHSSSLGHGRHSGGTLGSEDGHRVPPAYSPPRRPLSVSKSTPCLVPPRPPPKGAIPPLPVDAKVAPLKLKHVAITPPPPFTQQPLPTPPLPTSLASPTPQPKFDCILLASDVSSRVPVDPSRVIVTVETESSSFRTTLATLTSRESHLGTFLLNLLTPPATEPQEQPRDVDDENTDEDAEDRDMSLRMRFRDDDGDETEEEDHRHLRMPSIFKSHLAASGLIPPSPITPAQSQQPPSITHMHIFLDRASEPYEHVLTYLRSPEDQMPYLPPALQLLPHTPTSTATFIAVRDEAHFLGLRDLVTLCTTALRERYAPVAPPLPPRPMARTLSNVSRPTHSRNGSASSSMTHGAHAEARDSVDSASSLSAGMKVTFAATHRRLASRERLQVTGPDGVIIPPHPNNNIVGPPPPPGEKFQTVRVRRAAAWV